MDSSCGTRRSPSRALLFAGCCTARIAWPRHCIHSSFTVQHHATTLQFFQCIFDIQMGIPFWSVRSHSDLGELHHTTLPGPPVSGFSQLLRTRRGATRPPTFRSGRRPALRNESKTHPVSQILASSHTSYDVCVAQM